MVVGKTSKTFTIQADLQRKDGIRTSIRMATGEVGAINAREARNRAKVLIGQIGDWEDPRPPRVRKEKPSPAGGNSTVPDGVPTLREAWQRFKVSHLERKKRVPGTLRGYTNHMERLFADWLDRPFSGFGDEPILIANRHDLITQANGPAIANGAMRSFRAVYRHARRTCRKLPVSRL